ncbi:MAG: glycoside hydrolase family 16 protein [Devosia sp.]
MFRLIPLAAALFALCLGFSQSHAAPILDFAGQSWLVRTYGGGPGPNEWSGDNVSVDASGLHLRIAKNGGKWSAAEVFLLGDPLGFGTYQFVVEGPLAALDRNVVLGLFNYPGSPDVGPDGSNEIDIEIAQWGQAKNPNRLNWTVHPPTVGPEPTHKSVPLKGDGDLWTLSFTWSAEGVHYSVASGDATTGDSVPLAEWNDAPKSPQTRIPQQPLVIHMNLWLLDGKPPHDGKPVEVTVRAFLYTPPA